MTKAEVKQMIIELRSMNLSEEIVQSLVKACNFKLEGLKTNQFEAFAKLVRDNELGR